MKRRTRLKLAEYSIFGVVALTCLNSAYSLFTSSLSTSEKYAPMAVGKKAERSPASQRLPVLELSAECTPRPATVQTRASQVRIYGPLCGLQKRPADPARTTASTESAKPGAQFKEIPRDGQIELTSQAQVATMFIDRVNLTYSSELIPLEKGENKITLKFIYGKHVVPVSLRVTRSE